MREQKRIRGIFLRGISELTCICSRKKETHTSSHSTHKKKKKKAKRCTNSSFAFPSKFGCFPSSWPPLHPSQICGRIPEESNQVVYHAEPRRAANSNAPDWAGCQPALTAWLTALGANARCLRLPWSCSSANRWTPLSYRQIVSQMLASVSFWLPSWPLSNGVISPNERR